MNYVSQTFWSIAAVVILFSLDEVHIDSFGSLTNEAIISLESDSDVLDHSNMNRTDNKISDHRSGVIYRIGDVDVVPLYGMPCGATMRLCNQKNIADFIYQHIELPEGHTQEEINGLEFVKVIVEADGSVSDIQYIETKDKSCVWCQEAVVDVITKMSDWKPALKNGKTVAVQIIIPIQFLSKQTV